MLRLSLILGLSALAPLPLSADVTGPGGKTIDCYCTDTSGSRVELGQQICLYVDGRAFMARCEMALNNPIWRDTGESCLSSRLLPQSHKPTLDPLLIDAKI